MGLQITSNQRDVLERRHWRLFGRSQIGIATQPWNQLDFHFLHLNYRLTPSKESVRMNRREMEMEQEQRLNNKVK